MGDGGQDLVVAVRRPRVSGAACGRPSSRPPLACGRPRGLLPRVAAVACRERRAKWGLGSELRGRSTFLWVAGVGTENPLALILWVGVSYNSCLKGENFFWWAGWFWWARNFRREIL